MEAPARTTTASRRRRIHSHDHSKHSSVVDGEYLDSRASSRQTSSNHPNADELRRVRTEFYKRSPEDRRKEAQRTMDSYPTQRRHSRPRRSTTKVADISTRELRRDQETRHRSRREKNREEPEEDTGYVYRQVYSDARDGDVPISMPRRRASAPRATSRYEAERVRAQEPSLARRHTERRLYSRREAGLESSRSQRQSDQETATPYPSISRYYTADVTS